MSLGQVIVVGGGLAGCSAAHSVIEAGGSVLLLDKSSFLGGNSVKATSGINGALTKTQKAKGIADSAEAFEKDTYVSAVSGAPDAKPYPLAHVLTHESGPAIDWLQEKFNLDLSLVAQLGGHSYPRTHRGKERFPGMTITYALMERLEEIEKSGGPAKIIVKAKVTKLLTENGVVIGCEYVKDNATHAVYGPVILATGGYGADFTENSLLKRYRPDLLPLPTTNGDHCTGDGIRMAQEIGAEVDHLEWVQVHPTGLVDVNEPNSKLKFLAAEALRGVGGLLLTADGQRFCNELGRRDYVTGEMTRLGKGPYRLVMNGKGSKEIEWHCKHYCGRGLMKRFENGAGVAKELGVSAEVLAKTFADYNAIAASGNDPFGKKYFHNLPFEMNDVYHVAIVTPVIHYCMGGLKTTVNAEIESTAGKAIPGLYGTGEVLGGVHGKNRLGGNSLLDCVVFGRVAGRAVGSYLKANPSTRRAIAIARQIGVTITNGGISTRVSVNPDGKSMTVDLDWQNAGAAASGAAAAASGAAPAAAPAAPARPALTAAEVAKHNTDKDCWVIVNGKVLDVTSFLSDHPGGKKAIMLFAGRDASAEFNMLHKPDVIDKYAPQCVLGDLVAGGAEAAPAAAAAAPAAAAAAAHGSAEPTQAAGKVPVYTAHWSQPNNPMSLAPLPETKGSNIASPTSGGTADILPAERKKTTFETEKLINFLDGGVERTARRRFIISPTAGTSAEDKYYWERDEALRNHVKFFIDSHEEYWGKITPTREEASWMSTYSMQGGSLMNHYGLFLPTILAQGSDEQQGWWLIRALTMQIIGSYGQTELGHGSNVRGLQTIATYDKKTKEFVIHTPTLTALKWWPGTLGKLCTHVIVYAQLIIDGKEHGVQAFMCQVRDEFHRPLPGVELGDLGPKLGDPANDTGFARFTNFRVPREFMLSKYQEVTEDGQFVKHQDKAKGEGTDKLHYVTMMFTRGSMVAAASGKLQMACVIATRYSCVRHQGFADTAAGVSYKSQERQIIDYQVQRYRVFKQISIAYASRFAAKWMMDTVKDIDLDKDGALANTSALPAIAATAAGLKGLMTSMALEGIEDLRKCCGGNGYLLNSGIGQLSQDYAWQVTAEGDWVILILQTARFLLKSLDGARKGETPYGPCEYMKPTGSKTFKLESTLPKEPATVKDMRNLDYVLALFNYRALSIVTSASEHFHAESAAGKKFDEAFNSCAYEFFGMVKAHCHAFMLSLFVTSLKEKTKGVDAEIVAVLTKVCLLYALTNVLDDQWAGVLSRNAIRLARSAVTQLMEEIRPNAIALTDAFDFPDRVLASTIGRSDGNVYEALYEAAKKSQLNRSDPFPGYDDVLRKYLDIDLLQGRNSVSAL